MFSMLIFLVVLFLLVFVVKGQLKDNQPALKALSLARVVIGVAILVVLLISCIVQIGPGQVGVPILFGSVQDNVLKSGLNFINPLVEVEKLDIKTQAYTMSGVKDEGAVKGDDAILTLSSDGLTLRLDVTVWFRLSEGDAPNLLRTIGTDYVEKIVRPATRTALRDVTVMFAATDIYSAKRDE